MNHPFKKLLAPETKITKNAKWYAIAPLALLVIAILVVSIWNFNLGLDFAKGHMIKVTNINTDDYAEVKSIVHDALGRSTASKSNFAQEASTLGGIALSVRYPAPKGTAQQVTNKNAENVQQIKDTLSERNINGVVNDAQDIPARISSQHLMCVFCAIFAAFVGILLYMFIRFSFSSGIAAIVGVFSCIIMILSITAIFRIRVNFVFVAAIAAVALYSIYNTIVLFDRIREKGKDQTNTQTIAQKIDASIKETFWRTLITATALLVPVIILCVCCVAPVAEFALPIGLGLLTGIYSTICITLPLYAWFENAKVIRAKHKRKHS